jgi:protoheme IX farnesyltransferase
MKTITLSHDHTARVATYLSPSAAAPARSRLVDYVALTKPRVAVMVLFTVAAGCFLAGGNTVPGWLALHAVMGTALVAAGASALNQWLERESDARMKRTEKRPLPAGRMQPLETVIFGLALGVSGVTYLYWALPSPLAALLAALTSILYVGVYTPLKTRTTLNTLVGAIPGAMPPVIGWCAVRGQITEEAVALFIILFIWQVPHFLAIAWIYRDDYARAGLRMLPVADPHGFLTSRQMVTWCLALIPTSLAPSLIGAAGAFYLGGAVILGLGFLVRCLQFQQKRGAPQARKVMRASLLYLPGLLGLLLLDQCLPWLFLSR